MMTIKREEEWGAVYPHAPEYVHPFTSREFAEAHARSTGSALVKRAWVEVKVDPEPYDSGSVPRA